MIFRVRDIHGFFKLVHARDIHHALRMAKDPDFTPIEGERDLAAEEDERQRRNEEEEQQQRVEREAERKRTQEEERQRRIVEETERRIRARVLQVKRQLRAQAEAGQLVFLYQLVPLLPVSVGLDKSGSENGAESRHVNIPAVRRLGVTGWEVTNYIPHTCGGDLLLKKSVRVADLTDDLDDEVARHIRTHLDIFDPL